ncbi:MAG: hypothetical protein U9N82_08420, partial [Thermodesulfobacteriota bacterium]|nr:hypothetical protein [Thermodesulfobacteriota bacterium]
MIGKMFRFWFLIPVILAAFATIVPAAEVSDSAMQDEIKALKKMVIELQKRVQELEADTVKPGAGASSTVKTAEPEPSQPEIKAAVKAPPEAEEPVVAKAGAKAPAPLEIGGHRVRVGIAGAIQADMIHDFNAVGLTPGGSVEREFVTANIPVGGQAADITKRTGFSPNQSYLTGWAETDTPWGPFRVYADVNLFGSSTETEFQIYKAYGQWGWLKAGLDYTLWLNQAA